MEGAASEGLRPILPGDFLGLDEGCTDLTRARFVVLPVSYEKTTTFLPGTAEGPRAILVASHHVEVFDEELWKDFSRVGISTLPEVLFDGPPQDLAIELERRVGEFFRGGKRPIIIGGEHSISLGPVRAAARYWPDLSVLQFDAHADLRDSYEESRFGHACIGRRIAQECPLTQVGIRSLSEEEADLVDKDDITTFMARDVHEADLKRELLPELIGSLREHVYITFDVDVFDPALFPATGTPEPGGLDWQQCCEILRTVIRERDVVGMDIVETSPLSGHYTSEFIAARLAYKFICYTAQHQKLGPLPPVR